MEDRNDIDLTNLNEDTWLPCEKCVIRNPSCDDCKLMWTAQRIDENNIQRARIHERIDLTNEEEEDEEYWEEMEAQELAADAELDDSDSDDDVKEEEPEEMEVQILGEHAQHI